MASRRASVPFAAILLPAIDIDLRSFVSDRPLSVKGSIVLSPGTWVTDPSLSEEKSRPSTILG